MRTLLILLSARGAMASDATTPTGTLVLVKVMELVFCCSHCLLILKAPNAHAPDMLENVPAGSTSRLYHT